MLTVINTRLGENRGVPRVWLEGSKLSSSFQIGQKLDIQLDHEKKVAVLKVAPEGRFSVSKRDRNGRIFPLIEIKDDELGEMFGDVGVLLRVVIKNGVATIEVHGIDRKTAERVDRFNRKVKNGEALTIGSLFSGGGMVQNHLCLQFDACTIKPVQRIRLLNILTVYLLDYLLLRNMLP